MADRDLVTEREVAEAAARIAAWILAPATEAAWLREHRHTRYVPFHCWAADRIRAGDWRARREEQRP